MCYICQCYFFKFLLWLCLGFLYFYIMFWIFFTLVRNVIGHFLLFTPPLLYDLTLHFRNILLVFLKILYNVFWRYLPPFSALFWESSHFYPPTFMFILSIFFYMNHQVKYVLSKYFTLCGLFWNMISLSRLTLLNKTNCYSQRLYQLSMTLLSRGYNLCSHPTIHSGILCFFIFV